MKKRAVVFLLALSLLCGVAPALAGHGTIEETDDAIVVEYDGGVAEKALGPQGAQEGAAGAPGEGSTPAAPLSEGEAAAVAERTRPRTNWDDVREAEREARVERSASRRSRVRSAPGSNQE